MTDSLPRVTEILRVAGLVDVTWFTEEGRDRGSALHEATHFLDDGDLDWPSVDSLIAPRLHQYQQFLDEVKPEILAAEEHVTNNALRYHGHIDRIVRINGDDGIIDIKSPFRAPWQAIQLALYAGCFPMPMKRWTLHLHDERYQLIEHTNRRDWQVAKAAIVIAAWRTEHGEG